jgi:hypothetical protein
MTHVLIAGGVPALEATLAFGKQDLSGRPQILIEA